MIKGIVLNNGSYKKVKGLSREELFDPTNVLVLVDTHKSKIYIWVGEKTNTRDKFMAARLANMLRWKLFGGASEVIQKNDEALALVKNVGVENLEDLGEDIIKEILGIESS